jgi:hypothetical protein
MGWLYSASLLSLMFHRDGQHQSERTRAPASLRARATGRRLQAMQADHAARLEALHADHATRADAARRERDALAADAARDAADAAARTEGLTRELEAARAAAARGEAERARIHAEELRVRGDALALAQARPPRLRTCARRAAPAAALLAPKRARRSRRLASDG